MAHKMQGEKSLRRGSKSSPQKFTIFSAEVHEVLCRSSRGSLQAHARDIARAARINRF
ncbi:MAG: hypothetical protein IKT83_03020 [Bacteroidaceae bacterium]|nr:hypothetical protein [Bacteroidaceae bacterium]